MIAQDATALKVLVVDDSPETVLVASKFLRKMGHQPLATRSGTEALRVFEAERPDLVLLDVSMPEMDGYQTAAQIKTLTANSWVPVVFLTARTEDAAIARGIEVGGDDYLAKPIGFVMLKAKPDAFARMLRMQRQLERKSTELECYYQAAEEEQRIASHRMSQLVRADLLRDAQARLSARELKYLDVVPLLHGLIGQFRGARPHGAQIFLILSELFNNALDHGLLGMDSRIKNRPDGMEQFLEMREQRLMKLREASIDIMLERIADGGRPMINIRVRDSGQGFDYRTFLAASPDAGEAAHGRGIALVRSLCAELEYSGCGNEVSALYHLTPESALSGTDLLRGNRTIGS